MKTFIQFQNIQMYNQSLKRNHLIWLKMFYYAVFIWHAYCVDKCRRSSLKIVQEKVKIF